MKKLLPFALIAAMMCAVFASCENIYEEQTFLAGNRVQIIPGDTITVNDTIIVGDTVVVRDTVFTEKIVEIVTEVPQNFDCYDFNTMGNIFAHSNNHSLNNEFSFNFQMDVVREVWLTEAGAVKVSPEKASFNKGIAVFKIENGKESKSIVVEVPGANSVIINSKEIYPCRPFSVNSEMSQGGIEIISGKEYQVTYVTYTFLNGYGSAVRSAEQKIYSPVEPQEPQNDRVVSINHRYENGKLIIDGNIDNTIWPDTVARIEIPLLLTIEGDESKTVYGNSFACNFVGSPTMSSKNAVNSLKRENNSLVVTFNEYASIWTHNVNASGNNITLNPKVKYYNDFVVNFGGETRNISLNVAVNAINKNEGAIYSNGEYASKDFTYSYEAKLDGMSATASQEIKINVKAIYFDGEEIVWGNRSVSFDGVLVKGKFFDCLLTTGNDGNYYYHYRQVGDNTWTRLKLSGKEEFDYLLQEAQKTNQGLANFYDKSSGAWLPGVVWSENVKEAVIHANYTQGTIGKDKIALSTLVTDAVPGGKAVISTLTGCGKNLGTMNREYFITK